MPGFGDFSVQFCIANSGYSELFANFAEFVIMGFDCSTVKNDITSQLSSVQYNQLVPYCTMSGKK